MIDGAGPAGAEDPTRTDTTSAGPGIPAPPGPAHPSMARERGSGRRAGSPGWHRRAGQRARLGVAAGLAVLAVGAGVAGIHVLERPAEASATDVGEIPVAAPAPSTQQDPTRRPAAPSPRKKKAAPAIQPAAPASIRLAGITAEVVPTGVRRDGELEIPESPKVVGWWVGSAVAGSKSDSTVLAGHVDSKSAGIGALSVLRTVDLGTTVELTDVFRTTHRYKVVARRTYDKHDLPAKQIFKVDGPARLVLITCGGPFDERTGSYQDNVVVYAVPAR